MRPEGFDYETHSRLAGPFAEPDRTPTAAGTHTAYRVGYRSLLSREQLRTRIRAVLLMALAPVAAAGLLLYLVWPTHRTVREGGERWLIRLDAVMLGSIALIMLFMLVNVLSVAHATMVARDPVPVPPQPGTKVAFLTTYVPGKEPLAMVRGTLLGAVALRHDGPLDVWLLDEGTTPRSGPCARRSAYGTSPARASPDGTPARAPTGSGPSTATTTPGWSRTATTTSSSPPSTPTTSRCRTSWSGCSATSATRTSPSSSARRCTATTPAPSPRPPNPSSTSSTR